MLAISNKSLYGLRAVLALAEHFQLGLLQIKEIAAQHNIPPQYLEQIFNRLGKAGIVRSVRGQKGGFQLAAEPAAISVLDVLNILEGGIELAPTVHNSADPVAELLLAAQNNLKETLQVSLAELVARQQSLRRSLVYHI